MLIYTPLKRISKGYIVIKSGIIGEIGEGVPPKTIGELLDVENDVVAPGFIDTHTHGYKGMDASYAEIEDLFKWTEEITRHGVTALVTTTVALPHEDILRACRSVSKAIESWDPARGARMLGIHLEGPYISREKKSAQNPEYIRDFKLEEMKEYIDASDHKIR